MSIESDINISGMIDAERLAFSKFLIAIRENLHNSLEVCRLAKLQDPNITASIKLVFYIEDEMPLKYEIFDKASKLTGIKNLSSKRIYKLYDHTGTKAGYSGMGIGGKQENLRCCNNIQHHTITDTGIGIKK